MIIRITNHHSDNRIIQIQGSRQKLRLPPYGSVETNLPESAYRHLRDHYRRVDPAMEIDIIRKPEEIKAQDVVVAPLVVDAATTDTDIGDKPVDTQPDAPLPIETTVIETPTPKKTKRGKAK